jgi:hypothetical protein
MPVAGSEVTRPRPAANESQSSQRLRSQDEAETGRTRPATISSVSCQRGASHRRLLASNLSERSASLARCRRSASAQSDGRAIKAIVLETKASSQTRSNLAGSGARPSPECGPGERRGLAHCGERHPLHRNRDRAPVASPLRLSRSRILTRSDATSAKHPAMDGDFAWRRCGESSVVKASGRRPPGYLLPAPVELGHEVGPLVRPTQQA